MTVHAAIAAVPKLGTPNRTLLQALLVTRLAYVLGDDEDPEAFDPRGEGGAVQTLVLGYQGQWFWYDEADATTGHDGTTCIVTSATSSRYKVFGVDLLITSVISNDVITPPDPDDVDEELRPNNGDAYLVPTAAVGLWSGWEDSIAVWIAARLEWFRILPKVGWAIAIPGSSRDIIYRYDSVQSAWIAGDGASVGAKSVPLSAIIGVAGSLTVRVQNQTTYAPPGSRKTGATPTMPLGGTASNINDDSDLTTAVTSAIGNKSGATVANRIVGRLALASATDLIAIEVRGVLGSTTSSAAAMGLYYSVDGGANWTQAGAGFTLSATAQNVQRTGTFAGVTDVALVTEAKNWSTGTNTLSGLNAFDATVTATVEDAYLVPSDGIGVFAGMTGKVMICEVIDTFTVYTPADGDEVHDISLGRRVRWNGLAWESVSGALIGRASSFNEGGALTAFAGSGNYAFSPSTPPAGQAARNDLDTLTYTARAGTELEFEYQATIRGDAVDVYVISLRRDSETAAIDWQSFMIQTNGDDQLISVKLYDVNPGTTEHEYKIRFMNANTTGTEITVAWRKKFSVKEYIA